MSESIVNTNCSVNEPTCLCGIEVSIGTRFGVVEVTLAGGHFVDEELTFIDNQSVEWTDDLGVGYILNFSYNNQLGRWELSYDDIVIGVFSSESLSSLCPLSQCDWDLDCIAIDFKPNGITRGYYSWTGEYVDGRKTYYISSDWDGVSTRDYQIFWGLIPTSTGAPPNTYGWIFSDVTFEPIEFIGFLYTNGCPYGLYLSEWEGEATRFEIANPGVSDYVLKTKAIECGCCDTTLQLEIGVEGLGVITTDANVEYDAYGNILGINGKPYYVFEVDSSSEGCDCISVTYALVGDEPVTVEVNKEEGLINGKPFYLFGDSVGFYAIDEEVEGEGWILLSDPEVPPPYLFEDTPCPFGVYTIPEGSFFDAFEVAPCAHNITTYYLFFLDGEWVVKTTLGDGTIIVPPSAVLGPDSKISPVLDCPYGFYSTDLEFYSFWVRGVECFDCCNYYAPRFSNFIKKKKYDLVSDISSIRNKEIFGMKCGPEWSELFRKHLILDVLSCLPYGVLCEEDEQCLIKNVNENCNC
jgi:hypothetical protein